MTFVELNSYDIGGLSSAILICVSTDSFHYIFGAKRKGRYELCEDPTHPSTYKILFSSRVIRMYIPGSCQINLMRTHSKCSFIVIAHQRQLDWLAL